MVNGYIPHANLARFIFVCLYQEHMLKFIGLWYPKFRAKLQISHVIRAFNKQRGGNEISRYASKDSYNSRTYVKENSSDFGEDRLFR